MKIKLLHLYPDRMNIYGDFGNIIAIRQRLLWRGLEFEYTTNTVGDKIAGDYDLVFMGGGQDKGQLQVAADLQLKSQFIHSLVATNTPILTICGAYQLFGQYFKTFEGEEIPGINVLNVVTKATELRMIGNIVVESQQFGELVGFENHSGETTLLEGVEPLGKVKKGYGNNQTKEYEGVLYRNVIGTYMHGSFLPKNPRVADFLLEKAIQKTVPNYNLTNLDDWLEQETAQLAKKRPQ